MEFFAAGLCARSFSQVMDRLRRRSSRCWVKSFDPGRRLYDLAVPLRGRDYTSLDWLDARGTDGTLRQRRRVARLAPNRTGLRVVALSSSGPARFGCAGQFADWTRTCAYARRLLVLRMVRCAASFG